MRQQVPVHDLPIVAGPQLNGGAAGLIMHAGAFGP